ncbi:MAG: carbohydrate ABC transporter permease [Desulfobacterales bacterium]|nr:carbohydrate ABC transporter permease [Desulfobacterales bacterium]
MNKNISNKSPKASRFSLFWAEYQLWTRREKIESLLINFGIVLVFIFIMFPIFWVFGMAFKTTGDILAWPPKFTFVPTLDNFKAVLFGFQKADHSTTASGIMTVNFMRSYLNSFIISFGALAISVVIAIPAAYSLARYKFKGKEDLAFTILSFRFAPELLVIIPLFIIFQRIGLYDSYFGLMWVYQLITLPMIIWILRGDMEQVPQELEQSYMLDGYSRWQAVLKVVIPIVRPGLVAGSLLAFIYAWNNFIFGMVLASGRLEPATIAVLKFLSLEKIRYGEISAAALLICIPSMIFALFARKHLVKGLSMGAVKS